EAVSHPRWARSRSRRRRPRWHSTSPRLRPLPSTPRRTSLEARIAERRTSPVELLWDLVFVFAITQVATLLAHDLSWAGFGRAMLVLALVWWAWSAFAWATNAQDPDSAVFRGVLFLSTILILIVGLALPHAFGRDGTVFAVTYAGVRFLHLA